MFFLFSYVKHRYVWVNNGEEGKGGATCFVVNKVIRFKSVRSETRAYPLLCRVESITYDIIPFSCRYRDRLRVGFEGARTPFKANNQ